MSENDKKDLIHEVNVASSLYSFDTDTKTTEAEHKHPAEGTLERELTDVSLLYNLDTKNK
ncbi:MAG: hypothetical protein KH353_07070 [Clostridium sp.]|nr:hypothetical protein [Clostridium sp.]